MTRRLYVFVYPSGSNTALPAGLLEHDSEANVGHFEYGQRYQQRKEAIPLDPVNLPLGVLPDPVITNGGLYGVMRDSAPDFWGRQVIASQMACPAEAISEIDFLLAANATRVGNLDFREQLDASESPLALPQLQDLEQLMEAADRIDRGQAVEASQLQLLRQGSSLGGARPKCTVELDGALWLAKFSASRDQANYPAIEYGVMQLARRCGLNVPELRLMNVGQKQVFLIRRFDREKADGVWLRQGFLSSLSLCNWDERDWNRWSYLRVAERIRQHSETPSADLLELFLRIAFNILVRNTDDHPRNHGFLITGNHLRLSPLYDVVPSFARRGVGSSFALAMEIGDLGRQATLENLRTAVAAFGLKPKDADEQLATLRQSVRQWRDCLGEHGVDDATLHLLEPSFDL
jgi:serine/threonine-protein kinase HipA